MKSDAFRRLCRARDLLGDAGSPNVSVAAAAREASLSSFHFIRSFETAFWLKDKDVVFTMEPTVAGKVTVAIFSDTCGNLLQMHQHNS